MRKFFPVMVALAMVLVVASLVSPARCVAEGVDAAAVFDQLKSLAGTWMGTPKAEGHEAESEAAQNMGGTVHEIKVSAAGTVVMETMGPGTEHEMINMYHLDGDDLVLTHYCAGGNQPTMRLDLAHSTPSDLIFNFTGGTNLDPAVDNHIHAARIKMVDGGHMESTWTAFGNGEQVGLMTFDLAKQE